VPVSSEITQNLKHRLLGLPFPVSSAASKSMDRQDCMPQKANPSSNLVGGLGCAFASLGRGHDRNDRKSIQAPEATTELELTLRKPVVPPVQYCSTLPPHSKEV
jgi:hypothetical protein